MSNERFDVVFFGILQPGKDKEMVMQNMAKLFKTDAKKLAPYFSGGQKIIKGKISAEAAEKYKTALENVGLVITINACTAAADETVEDKNSTAAENTTSTTANTNDPSLAPTGSDIIENPVTIPAQKIQDISTITMAEAGANVIENPVEAPAQVIADISAITMAEVGADVIKNPVATPIQKIDELPDITLAEAGADVIENPKPVKKAVIPDFSELSLKD